MWWKIYFWIIVVLTVIGVFIELPKFTSWNFADWEGQVESVILSLSLYAYIYKKNIFSKDIWKYVFVTILVVWAAQTIYYATKLPALKFLEFSTPITLEIGVISMILATPALVIIYRLGFSAKSARKK